MFIIRVFGRLVIFALFLQVSYSSVHYDKLYKVNRLFVSVGGVLEPNVLINKGQLFENDNSSVFGGVKVGGDYIWSIYKRRAGFINKNKVFVVKLRDLDVYSRYGLKNDFEKFIAGLQVEFGISVVLNKKFDSISFSEKNRINTNLSSINFLVGFKEEIGKIRNVLQSELVFPTKLVCEIMYILDLKFGFSFYFSVVFFQCFSPVYLFSFNKDDFSNVFNNNNYFNWNCSFDIGVFGLNFFI